MICVLKIGGSGLNVADVRRHELLEPFRIDVRGDGKAKSNCVYYDVASGDTLEKSRFLASIEAYLTANKPFLAAVQSINDIEFKELDIGIMLQESAYSVSIDLHQELINLASRLDLSISVSTYRSSEALDA